jgi:MYXO-CTERM domain-containing protein
MAAGGATGAAAEGLEEPVGPRAYCLPGSVTRCLAFAITEEPAGFDVWLRALTPFDRPLLNPFTVDAFTVVRANAGASPGARTDLVAGFSNFNVATTGTAVRGINSLSEDTGVLEFPATRTYRYTAPGSPGVVGCALPWTPGVENGLFVALTCGERGADGWLRVPFRARVLTDVADAGVDERRAAPADVAVEVAGCVAHIGAASGVTGAFGGARFCDERPYASSVVPEPATGWTAGAGLAAVLAAARRRRRRA